MNARAPRRACPQEPGSISPGKAADLIAVACDPRRDVDCLRQVRGVIKAGQPFPMG